MYMQRTTSGAAGNALYTTTKYMRGATGIGLGTTIQHLRRTTSGAAGSGLSRFWGLLMRPFTTSSLPAFTFVLASVPNELKSTFCFPCKTATQSFLHF